MNFRLRRIVVLGLMLLAASGCSTGGSVIETDDADSAVSGHDADTTNPGEVIFGDDIKDNREPEDIEIKLQDIDVDDHVDPFDVSFCQEEGGFGCPCEFNSDCNSSWCINSSEGKVCSQTCLDECPAGWSCEMVQGPPDMVFVCLPNNSNLCRPCIEDSDCSAEGLDQRSFCLDFGPQGKFCGGYCDPVKTPCSTGFSCEQQELSTGAKKYQCVPTDGECDCTQKYIDQNFKTTCYVENEFGKCTGTRFCTENGLSACDSSTPIKELCNAEDDNCNGTADEGIEPTSCVNSNEFGSCTGQKVCQGGTWKCQAPDPLQEVCDGQDNNCDGLIDEGALDTDLDGQANCVDDDDDGDLLPDDEDNCPINDNPGQQNNDSDELGDVCDPDDDNDQIPDEFDCMPYDKDVYPSALEVCDGKDNNCDGLTDEGAVDTNLDGQADCVDDDDDGDGKLDHQDNCPLVPNSGQEDAENDGLGNVCDDDDDNDGLPDIADNCIFVANVDQKNSDTDNQGDACDEDDDNDLLKDPQDNCPTVANPGQENSDTDTLGNACDEDDDNDDRPDIVDNCPTVPNPNQADTDGDGFGDACTNDKDGDGRLDDEDNCPLVYNPGQANLDNDGMGDVCDPDIDGDTKPNESDNCPYTINTNQADQDFDGVGDVCDPDKDGDLVANEQDNCPTVSNATQQDTDGDGLGNACDTDDDGDTVLDVQDNCPLHANTNQADNDLDTMGDACDTDDDNDGQVDQLDNCPLVSNIDQADYEGDGLGDKCDPDDDNDGIPDTTDNCPKVANPGQENSDPDPEGDACDNDDDSDGIPDVGDNCPHVKNTNQLDTDQDGEGDACDVDDDNDGVPDVGDNCTLVKNGDQANADGDAMGDVCDDDDDNDGKIDLQDNCPLVSNPSQTNIDNDGWGDACDQDDDNDGTPDATDNCPGLANPSQANHDTDAMGDDCDSDDDNDEIPDSADNCPFVSNPGQMDTDSDGKGDACESDIDGDGVVNTIDNCISVKNEDQADNDGDGKGDECDPDDDNDGKYDAQDNCPKVANSDQKNSDSDFFGDACDEDDDNDGILDDGDGSGVAGDNPCREGVVVQCDDNCRMVVNPNQLNSDGDAYGDTCDVDRDGDGVADTVDNCPSFWNPEQTDLDYDGVGDACENDADGDGVLCKTPILVPEDCPDNCPTVFNPVDPYTSKQPDTDSDGLGNACDPDIDGDGYDNTNDNCPFDANPTQLNTDGDDYGDQCDTDDDNDNKLDTVDNCPLTPNPGQKNSDDDGLGDACDDDDDNDGVIDGNDNCPLVYNENQSNNDGDSQGDECDSDDDNDGKPDLTDNCPFIPNPTQANSDDDGMGNACDDDDDNDTWPDNIDNCPTVANEDQADSDGDGKGNACSVDNDNDGDPNSLDCQPENPAVYHGAQELCNGIDDNCSGVTDEEDAVGCTMYWFDYDSDSYGKEGDVRCLCAMEGKYTSARGGDCNDTSAAVNPEGVENCDTLDNNCNGETDEVNAQGCSRYYRDLDDDSFGFSADYLCMCAPATPYTATVGGDCQDNLETINPGVKELCNGSDDNCDGTTDEMNALGCKSYYNDPDQDGYGISSDSRCLCTGAAAYSALQPGDCDSGDPKSYPGAAELCDGKDNDCDTLSDEDDSVGCTQFYRDFDSDGFGLANAMRCLCAPTGDYKTQYPGDCNDGAPAIYPGAQEVCNYEDDDCDGLTDEEAALGCNIYYKDVDEDTYGDATSSKCICLPSAPYTAFNGNDCDDSKSNVKPGGLELCDNLDTNCNGILDDVDAQGCQVYYRDADKDGFGQPTKFMCICAPYGEYTTLAAGDCNDANPAVFPGAVEYCNSYDDDCDAEIDEGSPSNCSTYYRDTDADGFGLTNDAKCLCGPTGVYRAVAGGDCNDQNGTIYPGSNEFCNSVDDNCDGKADEEGAIGCSLYLKDNDSDGYGLNGDTKCLCRPTGKYSTNTGGDCNDSSPAISPLASETCNGVDDDCDNTVDEEGSVSCTVFFIDGDADGYGDAAMSKCLCAANAPFSATSIGDCNDGNESIYPTAPEICNSLDDDCDSQVDEKGATGCSELWLDLDNDTFGNPAQHQCLCAATGDYTATKAGDCNDANDKVNPNGSEKCNNFDDDCDGSIDEAGANGCTLFYRDSDDDNYGVTLDYQCLCLPEGLYTASVPGDCDDTNETIFAGAAESCNDRDDDCDGTADEAGATGCVNYYRDVDRDGYGITADVLCLCTSQGDYVSKKSGDCNDANALQNPDIVEKCDDIDNNCTAGVDEGCDGDDDGYCKATMQVIGTPTVCPMGGNDCNDNVETINPGAVEKCDDKDNNCVNGKDEGCNDDNDGYCDSAMATVGFPTTCPSGGNDCVDTDAAVKPSGVEICDNKDNNCNGTVDEGCDDDNDDYCDSSMTIVGTPTTCQLGGGDCTDTNPAIHPNAPELCNLADDDCDGVPDDGAPTCSDFFKDADGDGYGVTADKKCLCVADGNYRANVGGDCNDGDATIYPTAVETCNTKDDNCNGTVDDPGASGCKNYYMDADGDTYGVASDTQCRCAAGGSYTTLLSGDCNDAVAAVNPAAAETCNTAYDDNCNGSANDLSAANCSLFYKDVDGDNFGVTTDSQCLCSASGNYRASNGGDCNDNSTAINPNATELCNGADDDCDGSIDENANTCTNYYKDVDGDGYGANSQMICTCSPGNGYTATVGNDCNDSNAQIHPTAPELCNTVDDNCNGQVDESGAQGCTTFYKDADGDGYGLSSDSQCRCAAGDKYTASVTGDCNDSVATVNPAGQEDCATAYDDDCDNIYNEENALHCSQFYRDNDVDGYGLLTDVRCYCTSYGVYTSTTSGDCNDNSAQVYPSAPEQCDGLDNDCDSQVDEGAIGSCQTFFRDADGDGYGVASDSQCLCSGVGNYTTKVSGDCNDSVAGIHPNAIEFCNGVDDNCVDGVDELGASGCIWFYRDSDGDGYGTNTDTRCMCSAAPPYTVSTAGDCDDTLKSINPNATEKCDDKDNDCDDETDEGCDDDNDGYCDKAMEVTYASTCTSGGQDCDDTKAAVHPNAAEICNVMDDDCDSAIDEGTGFTLCPSLANATPLCVNGECLIESCNPSYYDLNATTSDGCECGEDANEVTGDTCGSAYNLGTLEDTGVTVVTTGNILPDGDDDWYVFRGVDKADTSCDTLNVRVRFSANPNSQYLLDIYRGSCSPSDNLCTGSDEFSFFTDYRSSTAIGECPCSAQQSSYPFPVGEGATGKNFCGDETDYYYVRVYRRPGWPAGCANYSLTVTNGIK